MSSEVQDDDRTGRDRTPLLWLGVGVLILIMVGLLFWSGRRDPNTSTVRARHILIEFNGSDPADRQRALELTNSLRERITGGEDFATLAGEYSADSWSAARGGDLGYNQKGVYDPKFEDYVWSAPVGDVSDVVETAHGFHLIVVEDRHLTEADRYEQELEQRVRGQAQ